MLQPRALLSLLLALELGPAPDAEAPAPASANPPPTAQQGLSRRVVGAARYYLDHAPPDRPDNCTGYLEAVFEMAGVMLHGGPEDLWARALELGAAHQHHTPFPGDIAFFDDTFDRNRNGRVDDPLSHVAVVLSVDAGGTILLAHGGSSRGRSTFRMNLRAPGQRDDPTGARINDNLRPPRSSDPPGTRTLASELFHGFATVRPEQVGAWSAPVL